MNVPIYNIKGEKSGECSLPKHFEAKVRFPLIKRAVLAEQSQRLQPKGPYKYAGIDTSAKYRGRKDDYGSLKNKGQAMLPREVLPKGRHGKVRRIPSSVKGRRAHPPKVEKRIQDKLNKKERRAAIIAALAATTSVELAKKRGHIIGEIALPIVMEDAFENITKTKEANAILQKIIAQDLEHSKERGRRKSGVGRRSQRKTYPRSALLVAGENAKVLRAAKNIAGVDACTIKQLSVELLAPGTYPGRLAVFTQNALKEIEKL
ncbi:50S ribosomal protein L4 [Candidatus Micrarchaeota archaeon CG1_02_47_40]|nr:MAG: 50S ribosomal protein L4 [Candidatus Micrarchaeota archaeon CG1_02_47_40]